MVKPRSKQSAQKKTSPDPHSIEKLANQLADKPYGQVVNEKSRRDQGANDQQEEMERITISVPQGMRYMLEDLVIERKRAKEPSRSVSAIARDALEDYFKKIGRV